MFKPQLGDRVHVVGTIVGVYCENKMFGVQLHDGQYLQTDVQNLCQPPAPATPEPETETEAGREAAPEPEASPARPAAAPRARAGRRS